MEILPGILEFRNRRQGKANPWSNNGTEFGRAIFLQFEHVLFLGPSFPTPKFFSMWNADCAFQFLK